MRRLSRLVRDAGFELVRFRGHSYVGAPYSGGYKLAIVDRGAVVLVATARLKHEAGEAPKAEGRRRSDAGEFLWHIAYASLVARKPV